MEPQLDVQLMPKGSTEPSLVKDECQGQEESQADPSLMRQPLDVVGKSEVLGKIVRNPNITLPTRKGGISPASHPEASEISCQA